MVPVKWGDQISIRLSRSDAFSCRLVCKGLKLNPTKNLAYRAAEAFSKHFKILFKAEISLIKNIPTGAGLGGGSGNAAVVLKTLAEWAIQQGISRAKVKRDLSRVAAKLGADVPFFLYDSACWCTGFGEKCNPLKISSLNVVIALPKTKVPTPWAYKTLDFERVRTKVRVKLSGQVPHEEGIPNLENDFEPMVLKHKPVLRKVLVGLAQSGAVAARMSGSGSAFFGIYSDKSAAHRAGRELKRQGLAAIVTSI